MADTKIEWATKVWNPTRGCSRVSPGCDRCYAMREARRHDHPGGSYEGLTRIGKRGVDWKGVVRVVPEQLHVPLRWRKPQRIFVNSMSDLFHESLRFEDIAKVMEVMCWGFRLTCKKGGACDCDCSHDPDSFDPDERSCRCWSEIAEHTYMILTKRPQRMREFFDWLHEPAKHSDRSNGEHHAPSLAEHGLPERVWLGVSVEGRAHLNRIEELRAVKLGHSGIRFVSFEPLLEHLGELHLSGIRWAIFGGESGNSGARPCSPDWIRSGVLQCRQQGVAPFVKQMGHWLLGDDAGFEPNHYLLPGDVGFVPPMIGPNAFKRPAQAIGFSLFHSKGGEPEAWPEDLRIREFPS